MTKQQKRKLLWFIFIPISVVTIGLVVAGLVFQKSDLEKRQGITDIFDISADGKIAFVSYEDGKAGIYLKDAEEKIEKPIVQLNIESAIWDIAFSPDGDSISYVVANKDVQANLQSAVHSFSLLTGEDEEIFNKSTLITEIEYHPKDKGTLFYLNAATFENYSPIASAHPHDFDLYSYDFTDQSHHRYTNLLKYSIGSLNISPSGTTAFVQMPDDQHAETAEDIFETKQKVFQIPLNSPEELSSVSDPRREHDIYDFTIIGDRHQMIFQSVSKTGSDGIFEYELYHYNWDTDEEKQLTTLKEHAGRPILAPDQNKVYFMVNKNFGKRNADFHLYQMDLNGQNVKEVILAIEKN